MYKSRKIKRKFKIDIKKGIPYILGIFIFLLISTLVYLFSIPKPNENIAESNNFLFENVNPKFKVGFGDKTDTSKQYVRFESVLDNANPFEEDKKISKWEEFKQKVVPSKKGFEMTLSSIQWSGSNSDDEKLKSINSIAHSLAIDNVETTTEVITSGRVIGEEESEDPISKLTVLNKDVYPGIDIEYQILEGLGVKEEIVIRNMEAYNNCEVDTECLVPLNEYVFELKLDEGLVLKRSMAVVRNKTEIKYYITDTNGNYIAHFLPTFAVDGAKAMTTDVTMDIFNTKDNNYKVVVTLNPVWLFSEERVFPIRIDPSIVHDTTTEFDTGYNYNTEVVTGPQVRLEDPEANTLDSSLVGYWEFDEDLDNLAISYPTDCSELRNYGTTASGLYRIDPDGSGGNAPFSAYCNMDYDGGGWTLLDNFVSSVSGDSDPYGYALSYSNIKSLADLTTAGYTTYLDTIESTGYPRTAGYLQMYYNATPYGYIQKTLPSYANEVYVKWGNWYTAGGNSCTLSIGGSVVQTLGANYGAATYSGTYTSGQAIRFQENGMFYVGEIWVRDSGASSHDIAKDLQDSTSNNNDAYFGAGTSTNDGLLDKAISFNGTHDYVVVSTDYTLGNTNSTLSAWVNLDSTSEMGTIVKIGYSNGFGMGVGNTTMEDAGNNLILYFQGVRWINTGVKIGTGWHHVAMTLNSSGYPSAYIDGQLVYTDTGTSAVSSTGSITLIGGHIWTRYLDATIDEVKVFNAALSADTIFRIYNLKYLQKVQGVHTSSPLDMKYSTTIESITWSPVGDDTGDGETPYSTTGLLAQWDFNETSGTTATSGGSCGSTCNGTLYNMTTTGQDAAIGTGWSSNTRRWGAGALKFDGVDDYFALSNNSSLDFTTGDFTIETWVKSSMQQSAIYPSIISKEGGSPRYGYNLFLFGSTDFPGPIFELHSNGSQTAAIGNESIRDGQWHHLVGVKTSTTISLYVDGVLADSGTHSLGSVSQLSYPFRIGRFNAVYADIIVDSTRVYNRAVTSSEVLSNYQSGNIEMRYRTSTDGSTWSSWSGSETSVHTFEDTTLYNTTDTGLISYWPMDETTGTTVEDVKGSNEGTATGALIDDGKFEKARYFDGTDDNVATGTGINLVNASFSIAAWAKRDKRGLGTYDDFMGQGTATANKGLSFGFRNTNAVYCGFYSNDLGGPVYANDTDWHYWVCTYNASTNDRRIYRDGHLVANGTATADYSGTGTFYIGRNGYGDYFHGIIDEARVYNTVLTAGQVYDNFILGTSHPDFLKMSSISNKVEGNSALKIDSSFNDQYYDNLLGYWKLDESSGSGAYLLDSGPNSYHATPTGTSYVSGKVNGARSFNGTSSNYVTLPSDFADFTSGLTIELWAYPTSTGSYARFVDLSNGQASNNIMFTRSSTTTSIRYEVYSGGASGGAVTITNGIINNQWHHYAVTQTSLGAVAIYRDGKLIGSGSVAVPTNVTRTVNYIGRSPWTGDAYYAGYMDEVKIYNRPFAPKEIERAYLNGKDEFINVAITSTDISSNSTLPFWIASDQLGHNMDLMYGQYMNPTYIPDSYTVGLWSMNKGYEIIDRSGKRNDGVVTGTTEYEGIFGDAREFDGTDDYISIASTLGLGTTNATIEAWIYLDSTSEKGSIAMVGAGGNGYGIGVGDTNWTNNGNDLIILFENVRWIDTNVKIGTGWHHVAMTLNATGRPRAYLDGELVYSDETGAPGLTGTITTIGGYTGQTRYFTGVIDEVRISNVERDADQMRQAFEIKTRTHPIIVDFKALLQSSNLISNSGDTSFSIDERSYGAGNYVENIDVGQKIIVKETSSGTEYIAQGDIATVDNDTGAVTVSSWDSGSTFPSGGFTTAATVFKWQREYVDIRYSLDEDVNAITRLIFKKVTNVPAEFWIDDMKKATYSSDYAGASFTPIEDVKYVQYENIFTKWDNNPLLDLYLTEVNVTYTGAAMEQLMRHGKWFDNNGVEQPFWWAKP